eukprot:TRINITY_DN13257_c0_g2_i2.p1 TRINITY_DN13257_c0_g2~~TRINITY_DN13257_c0_g2_i2.p1  ORF type:complete len:298 (-),score=63.95 TRINITY_DN13257_c0_g2_i2:88-981(-)
MNGINKNKLLRTASKDQQLMRTDDHKNSFVIVRSFDISQEMKPAIQKESNLTVSSLLNQIEIDKDFARPANLVRDVEDIDAPSNRFLNQTFQKIDNDAIEEEKVDQKFVPEDATHTRKSGTSYPHDEPPYYHDEMTVKLDQLSAVIFENVRLILSKELSEVAVLSKVNGGIYETNAIDHMSELISKAEDFFEAEPNFLFGRKVLHLIGEALFKFLRTLAVGLANLMKSDQQQREVIQLWFNECNKGRLLLHDFIMRQEEQFSGMSRFSEEEIDYELLQLNCVRALALWRLQRSIVNT